MCTNGDGVLTATRPPEKHTVHMYRVSREYRHCLGFVQVTAEFADLVYSLIFLEAAVLLHGRSCCVVSGLGQLCCCTVKVRRTDKERGQCGRCNYCTTGWATAESVFNSKQSEEIISPKAPDQLWGPTCGELGTAGYKQPERRVDKLLQCDTEVKDGWRCAYMV